MIAVPYAGQVSVYVVPSVTTTSDSTNYHIIKALRSGQDETGIALDSRTVEFTAYKQLFLGHLLVAMGDIVTVDVAITGSPSPRLSGADFAIRCELTRKEKS